MDTLAFIDFLTLNSKVQLIWKCCAYLLSVQEADAKVQTK